MKWLFLLFFSALIFFQIKLRFSNRNKAPISSYLEKEHQANNAPRREIHKDYFFLSTINLEKIKSNCSKKQEKFYEELLHANTLPMIRFDELETNTELKLKFGPSNLNKITNYENNYRNYFRLLNDMSEELIKNQENDKAEYILKYLIHNKSEFSKTYTLLIDLYKDFPSKLDDLKNELEQNEIINKNQSLKNLIYKNF